MTRPVALIEAAYLAVGAVTLAWILWSLRRYPRSAWRGDDLTDWQRLGNYVIVLLLWPAVLVGEIRRVFRR